MPLDILLEVFGHLHPLDLLHLARCTKSLRAILMHRSARAIWKQALSNVPGMPDCPSDLNEPQFANIAFSTHCHECLDTDIEGPMSILWAFRTRLCSSCREPMVSDNDSMSKLPLWNGTCLADLVPAANCSVGKGRRLRFYQWRRYSDMHGVFRDMRTVPDRDQYIAQRKAYMIQYAQDTDRCIEWTDRVLAEIKRAKEERRKARKAMKQERLNAQATIQEGQS
ncbi:hypothetical protein PLICRDRAFT_43495 [Plicaturopsis crispa FD-325 SS-3]|nr:hypothetical protein PLICRDRAFT_43495 [Plicaturopsis crispa FD-325 SS-3]